MRDSVGGMVGVVLVLVGISTIGEAVVDRVGIRSR